MQDTKITLLLAQKRLKSFKKQKATLNQKEWLK
jgi:hypothetical protein